MKKKYEKPQIFIESFEVAEFIAGNCLYIWRNLTNPDNCTVDVKFGNGIRVLFNSGLAGSPCDMGNDDGACYHIATDSSKLQNS